MSHKIKIDSAHHALHPKCSSSLPKDIICVYDCVLKERIMAKARAQRMIDFAGASVQLYPDLSWLTLPKRRHRKLLLVLLKDHGITYRLGFPFALPVSRNGHTVVLQAFKDLPLCTTLAIPSQNTTDRKLKACLQLQRQSANGSSLTEYATVIVVQLFPTVSRLSILPWYLKYTLLENNFPPNSR